MWYYKETKKKDTAVVEKQKKKEEDAKKLEEQKKKEEEAKKLEEQKKQEEAKKLEEQKKAEEAKRQEELKRQQAPVATNNNVVAIDAGHQARGNSQLEPIGLVHQHKRLRSQVVQQELRHVFQNIRLLLM